MELNAPFVYSNANRTPTSFVSEADREMIGNRIRAESLQQIGRTYMKAVRYLCLTTYS